MFVKKVIVSFPYKFGLLFSFGLYSFIFFLNFRFFVKTVKRVGEGIWNSSRFFFYSSSRWVLFIFFDFFFRFFESKIFFFKVNLVGLGFNVWCIDDVAFRFYLGYSHYIYFFPGFKYRVFCNNKNKFLFVGFSREFVLNMFMFFIGLRKSNIYKMCGIYRQGVLRRFKDNRHNK